MQAVPEPRPALLCDTSSGPLLVYSGDAVIGRSVASRGHFDESKIEEVAEFLARVHGASLRTFIDIGANIGTHLLFALRSGRFDEAVGVEADPDNFALLRANVGMRGETARTRLFHCALSDTPGQVQLELCPTNYGDHRVRVPGVAPALELGESGRRTVQVPAETADELFAREQVDVAQALVWMDTQGHEGQILAGGARSLAGLAPAAVLEFWPYGLDRAGGRDTYFAHLRSCFAVYDVNRPGWAEGLPVSIDELESLYDAWLAETREGHYPHTDLLCVRRQAASTAGAVGMGAKMDELQRSMMTISCRDSDPIPKVAGAGGLVRRDGERLQRMHNGLEVVWGGYYGEWMAHIIRSLQGHHEPQEELIFHTLLRYVRHDSVMAELGAFWAYYTLWYLQAVPGARALCVEPDAHNISVGMHNAHLNGVLDRADFMRAWVGGQARSAHEGRTETSLEPQVLPVLDAAAVLERAGAHQLELLHMDVQGAELALLRSIDPAIAKRLRFVMASTHHSSISGSATIHGDCIEHLRSLGATILVEHDVVESFSGDGLILASFLPADRNLPFPPISRNRPESSLFAQA